MSGCTRTLARRKEPPTARRSDAGALRRAAVKSACEREECAKAKGVLQRAAVHEHAPQEVPDIVYDVLRSPGEPLDVATRAFMESRFRHDFSAVRVHTDTRAAESARAVSARAYTVGSHIAFAAGRYAPETSEGRLLLAHELTHTIQQSHGLFTPNKKLAIAPSDSIHEHSAIALSNSVVENAVASAWSPNVQIGSLQRAEAIPFDRNAHKNSRAPAIRTFFLTFDDGPDRSESSNGTAKVLDALKLSKYGPIKAGFFIQTGPMHGGSEVGRKLVRRMYDEGHIVGIHTGGSQEDHEPHPDAARKGRLESELESAKVYVQGRIEELQMEKPTVEFAKSEITPTSKQLNERSPRFVRPPYGAPFIKNAKHKGRRRKFTKEDEDVVRKIYRKTGLTNVMWDIDGDRGTHMSKSQLFRRISDELKRLQGTGWKTKTPLPYIVVLYHDIQKGTADNIYAIFEHIKETTEEISGGKDRAEFTKR